LKRSLGDPDHFKALREKIKNKKLGRVEALWMPLSYWELLMSIGPTKS